MPLPNTFGTLSARGLGLFSAPAAVLDPYFKYVTMLLHGDGTNGAQNNTFLDSSTNNYSITRNGNTTQGSFSPYGSNWSNYFDGSSYLTVPANAAFNLTGDFTLELWVNPWSNTGTGGYSLYFGLASGGGDYFGIKGGTQYVAQFGSSGEMFWTGVPAIGVWTHLALVRSGSTVTLYVNGTSVGTNTKSTTWLGSSTNVQIGAFSGGQFYTQAYISNLRLVKGTAVYTSAFTPSTTPLTAITNTSLLTCQSNRFIDNSTNAFTITVNGTPSVQRFSPFSPSAAYSTSTIGGSGYFDGSGDYLSIADNAALDISGDFTIEMWLYVGSGNVNLSGVIGHRDQSTFNTGTDWVIRVQTTDGKIGFGYSASGDYYDMGTYRIGEWGHYAVSRSGSTVRTFKNGVLVSTVTDSSSWSSTQAFYIGRNIAGYDYVGYISNLRLVKGTAVYTSNFTPPTAPVTAITNTSLLTNFTNGGIYDNAMMTDLETVGTAQISTSVFKYGTGSIAVSTGNYLTEATSPLFSFGSGNFTVEGWFYVTSGSSWGIFEKLNEFALYGDTNRWVLKINNVSNVFVIGWTPTASTWYHFACVRNGATTTMYINGTSIGSGTSVDATAGSGIITVGYTQYQGALNGYIDDFRVTRGIARYTANFTAPTAAFPNQ